MLSSSCWWFQLSWDGWRTVAWVRGVFLRVLGLRDFLFRHTVTGDWLWCTTETITMEGEWNRFHRLFPCNNHVKMSKWWGTDIIHNMCFPTQRQNHRTLYERSPRSVATSWRLHVHTNINKLRWIYQELSFDNIWNFMTCMMQSGACEHSAICLGFLRITQLSLFEYESIWWTLLLRNNTSVWEDAFFVGNNGCVVTRIWRSWFGRGRMFVASCWMLWTWTIAGLLSECVI